MKLLTRADNLITANIWLGALRAAGIECELRNTTLAGAMGEIPYLECAPQLWIARASDEAAAHELLRQVQQPSRAAAWLCDCGEVIEGQFSDCWACGAARAA